MTQRNETLLTLAGLLLIALAVVALGALAPVWLVLLIVAASLCVCALAADGRRNLDNAHKAHDRPLVWHEDDR